MIFKFHRYFSFIQYMIICFICFIDYLNNISNFIYYFFSFSIFNICTFEVLIEIIIFFFFITCIFIKFFTFLLTISSFNINKICDDPLISIFDILTTVSGLLSVLKNLSLRYKGLCLILGLVLT